MSRNTLENETTVDGVTYRGTTLLVALYNGVFSDMYIVSSSFPVPQPPSMSHIRVSTGTILSIRMVDNILNINVVNTIL
jgi:hypothetical protein